MCGISGYYDSENTIASLNESLNILQHRGPDDSGIYVDNSSNIGLGHRRLSIIDTSILGHQPMLDSKKKIGSSHLSKEYYLDEFIFSQKRSQSGVNAMSISDITGIPRATVIRKLKKLVKNNFLKIDSKKHYYTTGHYQKIMLNMQKKNFLNLSKFAASIYNLNIHQRIN